MKRAVVIVAGLALTGGIATAAEQQDTQEYDSSDTRSESELSTSQNSSTHGAETGTGVSGMSSEELVGRPVITDDGGLIGTIQEVGYSETHQARVATVDVGGFLGVGRKVIAIPLAELNQGSDDGLLTQMTEESIENREEFDMSDLTPDR